MQNIVCSYDNSDFEVIDTLLLIIGEETTVDIEVWGMYGDEPGPENFPTFVFFGQPVPQDIVDALVESTKMDRDEMIEVAKYYCQRPRKED